MSTGLARHELKLLNLGLIFYILLGALLFHSLGEFDQSHLQGSPMGDIGAKMIAMKSEPTLGDKTSTGVASRGTLNRHLAELRLGSVRRMWNITNRLNILYETNWTELVLAELIDFERRFVESISVTQRRSADYDDLLGAASDESDDGGGDDDSPGEEIDVNEEEEKKKNRQDNRDKKGRDEELERQKKKRSRLARLRLKSIKMSLVHSIATVTTMSSPIKSPSSQLGKVATILYGSLGIPLLLFTVTKSGLQVAQSSLNGLLVVRHFCFRLPLHYLCSLCNLCLWLRLLSWCCCCCCCSYLLCHLFERRHRKKNGGERTKRAPGCCGGHREAPKLRLRPPGGAGESQKAHHQQHQSAYVIGFNHNHQPFDPDGREKPTALEPTGHETPTPPTEQFFSPSLFLTSLAVLVVYVSAGAYYYSRAQNISLVDATFACYSMLSTSKLPESFQLTSSENLSLFDLYNALTSRPAKLADLKDKRTFESMLRDSIYLLIGLNLISACAQFARLWLNGEAQRRLANQSGPDHQPSTNCNGGGPFVQPPPTANNSLGGSFNQQPGPGDQMGGSFGSNNDQFGRLAGPQQQLQHRQTLSIDNSLQSGDRSELIGSNKSPEQIDLAELFVVDEQTHEFEMQPANFGPSVHRQPQQQLVSNSGGSFASDRSSDARSLCLHHQAQVQQQQQQQAAILTGGSLYGVTATAPATVYGTTRNVYNNGQHGSHLQLSSRLTNGGPDDEDDDEAEDEGDLERMLKTCDVQNGATRATGRLRPSSSSSQLNVGHPAGDSGGGQQVAPKGQHHHHHNHHHHHHNHNHQPAFDSSTVGRARPTKGVVGQAGVLDYTNGFARSNGFAANSEQVDSSPNTIGTNSTTNNSQTVSSMSSRRATVSFNNPAQTCTQTGQVNGSGPEDKQIGFIYRH